MYSRLFNFSSALPTIRAILVPFHNNGQALPRNLFQGGESHICGLYNMGSMVYNTAFRYDLLKSTGYNQTDTPRRDQGGNGYGEQTMEMGGGGTDRHQDRLMVGSGVPQCMWTPSI